MIRPDTTAAPTGRRPDPQQLLAIAAALVTIALTAAGFWLSYEHLHDLATAHGLAHSTARAWAWPATVDMFIVVGELLVLRSSLLGRVDPFAIFLTALGSGGSITLNIFAVGTDLPTLDYVVAAIPPAAALLAFGALMRQIHAHLAPRVPAAVPAPDTEVYPGTPTHPDRVHPADDQAPVLPRRTPIWLPEPSLPATAPEVYPPADQYSWLPAAPAVPAGVPGYTHRVQGVPAGVPLAVLDPDGDDAIEPDPDPDPAADRTDEDLADHLLRTYATLLLDGRMPSIRMIRRDLGVGQERAQRLQKLVTSDGAL